VGGVMVDPAKGAITEGARGAGVIVEKCTVEL
jgi:hypothetical protein